MTVRTRNFHCDPETLHPYNFRFDHDEESIFDHVCFESWESRLSAESVAAWQLNCFSLHQRQSEENIKTAQLVLMKEFVPYSLIHLRKRCHCETVTVRKSMQKDECAGTQSLPLYSRSFPSRARYFSAVTGDPYLSKSEKWRRKRRRN